MRSTTLFGMLMLPIISWAQAGASLESGWEKFVANDYAGAAADFTSVIESTNAPEAYLSRYYAYTADYQQDKAAADLRAYVGSAEDPTPALRALWASRFGANDDEEIEFLEGLIENYNGTIRAIAAERIANLYRGINELDDSEEYFEMLGSVDTWAALGEFENISESGYDKDFGALANPGADATFVNKVGAEVKWFRTVGPRHDKWFDMEYFFYASNSIIYAQNFAMSPVDQEVQMRIGVSGSVKVWVNDKLMFEERDERNNGIDSYMFTAQLNRGYNRILIQLGESEADNMNFMLRITDMDGNLVEDLEYTTDEQPYTTETAYESMVYSDAVIDHYNAAIEADPNSLLNYLLLNDYYMLSDNTNESRKLLSRASENFEGSNYVLLQELMTHVREGNSTQVSTLIEEIKLRDPNNVLGLNLRFSEAMDLEDYELAEEILDDLRSIQGMSANVYDKMIELASALENREELIELALEAYEVYPDNYDFVMLKYSIESEANQNMRRAYKALDNYIDDHYSETALRKMASYYFEQQTMSGIEKGLEIYEDMIENEPVAIGYYNTLARINFLLRRYDDAEEYAQQCLTIAPYIGAYYSRLAETYAEIDESSDAIEAYKMAIKYDPYDYDSRHALRELLGKGSIFDMFETVDVYDAIDAAPDASEYPEDNAVIVVNHNQRVFYEGGGNEERHVFAVKVFNIDGVDSWKEFTVPVYGNQSGSIEKAEVVKANGSRTPAETSGARVIFETLEPGDAIHITYRLESRHSGKLAEHIWGNEYFEFYIPSISTKLELMLPQDVNLQYVVENGDIDMALDTLKNGDVMYTWETSNTEAIRYESTMPPLTDVGRMVHYTTFEDWNFVSDWYTDLVSAKSKVDYEVELTVAEIFPDGHEGMSDYEKAKKIHDYIVENIRYRSVSFLQSGLIPQRASTTLSAKQGDCKDVSVLFATLCKEVGLDADLVLINTRSNGEKEMMLPSINFNHCIASVKLDGSEDPYYVELTSDKISFATRTNDIEGAFALPIPLNSDVSASAAVLDHEMGNGTATYRYSTISFDGSDVNIERNCVKTGMRAASMRYTYRDEGPEQQHKFMQEAINDEYPGVKLDTVEFISGLHSNVDSVEYRYVYGASDVTTSISDLEIFEVPFTDGITSAPSYISMETRKYPIELWEGFSGRVYHEELTINVPSGKRLAEVPADVSIITEDISYKVTYQRSGNALKVTRDFQILDDIVEPEDYEAFKSAMEKIVKSDTQNVAFR